MQQNFHEMHKMTTSPEKLKPAEIKQACTSTEPRS